MLFGHDFIQLNAVGTLAECRICGTRIEPQDFDWSLSQGESGIYDLPLWPDSRARLMRECLPPVPTEVEQMKRAAMLGVKG